jgi:hypothetical protein
MQRGDVVQLVARPRTTAGAKQVATQHWITAGVAVAGASLIAVAPGVTPVPPDLQHELQASAVRLTAGWDPLAAWKNAFNTTSGNASTIADNFFLAPGVGLQQAIVNEVGYLNEVLNDPSSIGTVLRQFATNAQTVASGLTGLNASAATATAVHAHTLDGLHGVLLGQLPGFLPPGVDAAAVTQVLQVLSSPMSGLLIGAAGPVISPGVALLNTALAVGAAMNASDPSAALSDLLDAPANVVNAVFNGADLNLDALVPLINNAGILPAGTTIDALDVAFGGLFTVGSVSQGTYTQNGKAVSITTPGGSILNSLGLTITTDALTPGTPAHHPLSKPRGRPAWGFGEHLADRRGAARRSLGRQARSTDSPAGHAVHAERHGHGPRCVACKGADHGFGDGAAVRGRHGGLDDRSGHQGSQGFQRNRHIRGNQGFQRNRRIRAGRGDRGDRYNHGGHGRDDRHHG